MKALAKPLACAAAAAMALSAVPAQAQSYPYDRSYKDRDTVDEVVDGIARVAGAVAAVAHGGYYDPRVGNRFGRGFERHAVDACRFEAHRRYGRYGPADVDVHDIQYRHNGRIRVSGSVEVRDRRSNRRWDHRWGVRRVPFTCDVNRNGRVNRFRTHNYRW